VSYDDAKEAQRMKLLEEKEALIGGKMKPVVRESDDDDIDDTDMSEPKADDESEDDYDGF
jgi:hypothetical protein